MQNKTARQLQNELEFMRRAYADRERRLQNLNHYLGDRHPIARPVVFFGSLTLAALFLISIIF